MFTCVRDLFNVYTHLTCLLIILFFQLALLLPIKLVRSDIDVDSAILYLIRIH